MRRCSIFLFIAALSTPFFSYGQPLFEPKVTLLSEGDQRDFVLADDFDNDGDQDLLTLRPDNGDCCGGAYFILYNDGAGNFAEEVLIYNAEVEWDDIRTGNLDSDSLPDVIIHQLEEEQVLWLQNNGSQEFTLKNALITGYTGGAFDVADFTGDGLDDVLYVNSTELLLRINQGNETFGEPTPVASGELVHTADFDADGLRDLFTIDETGNAIVWHRNNGDGTFMSNTTDVVNEIPSSVPDLLVADFGGDETNELIISYPGAGEEGIVAPKLYTYDESGGFALQSSLTDPETFDLSPSYVTAGDIDQDGDLDVLASFKFALAFSRIQSDFDEYVGWYENAGGFQFTPRLLEDALWEGVYIDLSNDQRLDVLFDVSGELIWQENQGQGAFTPPRYLTDSRTLFVASLEEGISTISFGDLNQDGLPELVVSEEISNKVQYFANEDGTPATSSGLLTLNTLRPTDAAIFEATGDELNDVIVIGGDDVEGLGVFLYPNLGGFVLGEKDTLYMGLSDAALIVGDFNGDTRLDIALTDRSQSVDGEIVLLSNQGNQTFEIVDTQIVGDLLAAVDIDGDAKVELITSDGAYTQTTESEVELIRSLDFPFSHIADINGDNLGDFLLFSPDEVTLYLAQQEGTYQEQTLIFEGEYDLSTAPWLLMDVDGDQDQDFVFINDTGTNRELAYLLNVNGTTTFGQYTVIDSYGDTNFRLFNHDIDQDSDQDLVVLTDTELAWYKSTVNQGGEVPQNTAPTIANPIEDQQATANEAFSLVIAGDVFQDADEGDTLTLMVTLSDDSALPEWLSFDPQTNTLSGTPPEGDTTLIIKVTATDGAAASVSDEFTLTVGDSPVTSLDDGLTSGILVYPVPAIDRLFLESRQEDAFLQSYQLLDIQGKVLQRALLNRKATKSIRIDVSSLEQGIYLLEVHTRNRTYQRRVLIE